MGCALCSRDLPLTFHHLIPRTLHSKKWFQKNFTRDEMARGIDVCKACHDAVHRFIPEKLLGTDFNTTADKLLAHDKVRTFVEWVKKRGGSFHTDLPPWHSRK